VIKDHVIFVVCWIGVLAAIFLLGGCSMYNTSIGHWRTEGQECNGKVLLEVEQVGEERTLLLRCMWEEEE
jgi:hypothetical protein